jgi:hypothetical protein
MTEVEDDETGCSSGSESDMPRQGATSPRQAAELLGRELNQLEAGDISGGVAVLSELLVFLEEETA